MSATERHGDGSRGERVADWFDGRLGIHTFGRKYLRKVFPDHWSFLLGEICLYSFAVLILTGVYLTFFFHPSMNEVTYEGGYVPLNGVRMSEAYASTLDISFEVRGGLLMRQLHHWSALIFVAGMLTHMMRHFFTGSFRKPREVNWLFGWTLLFLGLFEGLFGYSLPDDLLSGTGLRFLDGALLSVPIVGTYLSMFLFGGEFPGDDIVARLYSLHVLVIPGVMAALVVAHIVLVVHHKHTQFAGPGRTERNVVGAPFMPVYLAKAGGFFFLVFGVLTLIAGVATINPVWAYGPYRPDQVSTGAQPDWYRLNLSINAVTWAVRISMFVVPAVVLFATRRICLGLQLRDRELVEHGRETGLIKRLPHGEYTEVHQPLDQARLHTLTAHERPGEPVEHRSISSGPPRRTPSGSGPSSS
ncbi:cytochrome bc complex cytochrome b subunit [Streptomyces sp. NPDC018693]|uniref:cytochrome bc1 complex cytochrome b subunit n=1 Tax=unclassified Streptomyces TaxID=2593676 RepID=UPI0037BA3541